MKEEVQKNLDEANTKQATPYNLRRRPIEFKVGDRVLKIATVWGIVDWSEPSRDHPKNL